MQNTPLKIIVVAGTSSNSGKTTLVCELLRQLTATDAWEAIKLSRGHYRSCGKDPHTCCVSGLLGATPTIRSGRAATFPKGTDGKDTGRFWEAGASNVHWVIATDEQVEAGMQSALARVKTAGVIIEGTSILRYLKPDFSVLALKSGETKGKASARQAIQLQRLDAVYLNELADLAACPDEALRTALIDLPAYDTKQRDALLAALQAKLDMGSHTPSTLDHLSPDKA